MFRRCYVVLGITCLALLVGGVAVCGEVRSAVPPWDDRGSGPLPWQGIACLDIRDGAKWIALGTIAPPGDPNVFLLDGAGRLVRTARAGQRWIQQVAVDRTGEVWQALCTMPAGRAGDFPTVFAGGRELTAVPPQQGEGGWPQNLFQYGDHSNHTGVLLRGFPRGGVVVYDRRVLWLPAADGRPEAQVEYPRPPHGVTVSLAAGADGVAVVGCAASDKSGSNLFLLSPRSRRPLWSRPALVETDRAAHPEKGLYGTPTLPDGRRAELPQRDVPVHGPLSLAVFGTGESRRIAAADYPGWQRWIRSSATGEEQNYGTRFVPARPVVSVYDGHGKLLRRFGAEHFAGPLWVDLVFSGGGKYVFGFPHSWTCRGLAGQTVLPADAAARTVYLLDVETGRAHALAFPDAVSGADAADSGRLAVGCWNGRVYLLDADQLKKGIMPEGLAVGGPSLVRVSRDGTRVVVAATKGEVRLLDNTGRQLWRQDLNRLVKPARKPWVANARAEPLGPGVWQLPGGRVESDLGGQRVVEAPDGLVLIEAHAGLSFEREWAAMKAVGLDPRRVKYVLATHEHGDHAPGAYLWRVVTGARFVCSAEMAYALQHHPPLCSGYGLHPPVPTDLRVTRDTELDLAGLKVHAVRLPGHTFGSMAWLFTRGRKKYVAFGDLIMPEGRLGYSGSINFSGRDVLASLRKLRDLKPDVALPGHGPTGDPSRYLAAGIDVGVHVGWGKVRPERPDPYFRITQKNVRVVAWNIDAASAAVGDIDGDGKPDVAVVCPEGDGAAVKIFLNHGGTFRDRPDHVIAVPGVAGPSKIRLAHLNDDKVLDILVGGRSSALLLSEGKLPGYKIVPLGMAEANRVRRGDVRGRGRPQILVGRKFGGFQEVRPGKGKSFELVPMKPDVQGPYADFRLVDLNGDGRPDLVTSAGRVYLRRPDGKLPAEPTFRLELPDAKDWTFLGVGDFNGDGKPDVALLSYGMERTRLSVFYNTGKADRPFTEQPNGRIDLAGKGGPREQHPLLRDRPIVADWNGDGIPDLVVGKGQDNRVLVLLGGRDGLDLKRSGTIALDYRLHYETGLFVADFDGDGVPDLAALGYTSTGVGLGGPPAVYIWRQVRTKGP